ncbi:cystathionine beta-lyase [Ottowia thiooxydans]|uniref:cystathionine beta-lyase n=1 Tax=Ottowia thiooxydans TaxID=219182 RepID=UPI0012EC85D4|nr:cystathionine beta-lyase [Ottowia thiooxydans]
MESNFNIDTRLLHAGRNPASHGGLVNTPVCRGSTIVAPTLQEWEARKTPGNPYASYGRFGSATTLALQDMMAELEGGHRSLVFPSGLAACTHALLAFVRSGDHVLMTDSVYGPTRSFAEDVLSRLGVEVEFYDPTIGAGIRQQMRKNTRLVFVESPGSATFDIQDIPAISAQAHEHGAFVVMDNTWASPLFFKAFEHGVDVSIQAATKYLVGHSDALMGVATANERAWPLLKAGAHDFGQTTSPDDIFLVLRGLRTLSLRMQRHWESGVRLAKFLQQHSMVERVLHPALPEDPGHALWKRDFQGASGLFAFVLLPLTRAQTIAFFNSLKLFGIGLSWGGFESLALPMDAPKRAVAPWTSQGQLVRVHVGLEDYIDLEADMAQALEAAAKAAARKPGTSSDVSAVPPQHSAVHLMENVL